MSGIGNERMKGCWLQLSQSKLCMNLKRSQHSYEESDHILVKREHSRHEPGIQRPIAEDFQNPFALIEKEKITPIFSVRNFIYSLV